MTLFKPYDAVRIAGFAPQADTAPDAFSQRPPRIGDVATVIERYASPPGYELECSADGSAMWQRAFRADEVTLEPAAAGEAQAAS